MLRAPYLGPATPAGYLSGSLLRTICALDPGLAGPVTHMKHGKEAHMVRRRTVAFGVACLVLAMHAYADINEGIISAWTFDDGTARDAMGVGHGTMMGAAAIADGRHGKGVDLDGVDAFVEIPHAAEFEAQADAFSIAAWVFNRSARDHSGVVWKGAGMGWGPNFAFRIALVNDPNITWGTCPPGIEGWFTCDGSVVAGEWMHVCMTADGSSVSGYVNAELPVATAGNDANNPSAIAAPYQTFPEEPIEIGVGRNIGALDNGVDNYLDGIVDEVYFYDRALTAEEVAELSEGARPNRVLAVDASGKVAVAWGDLKARP